MKGRVREKKGGRKRREREREREILRFYLCGMVERVFATARSGPGQATVRNLEPGTPLGYLPWVTGPQVLGSSSTDFLDALA